VVTVVPDAGLLSDTVGLVASADVEMLTVTPAAAEVAVLPAAS
jgi:hypothetical protein